MLPRVLRPWLQEEEIEEEEEEEVIDWSPQPSLVVRGAGLHTYNLTAR